MTFTRSWVEIAALSTMVACGGASVTGDPSTTGVAGTAGSAAVGAGGATAGVSGSGGTSVVSGSGGSTGVAGAGTSAGGSEAGGRSGSGGGGSGGGDRIDAGVGGSGIVADASSFGASCVARTVDARPILGDLFVMLDKSGSMNCPAADDACEQPPLVLTHPTRWEAVATGLTSFLNAPSSAGVGIGIGFFPSAVTAVCNVAAYTQPTVPIAELPAAAAAISMAIALTLPNANTPTVPALQGAVTYAQSYASSTPGRAAAVVLITDGIPNGCNSSIPGVSMVASSALNGTPPVKTFVLGLGATASLDEIALAGSGGTVHYFPISGDVATQLPAALASIASRPSCDYAIAGNGMINPYLLNVVSVSAGVTQPIGHVSSSTACGSTGGWYYDNPSQPTKLTLCPQSCQPIQSTPGLQLKLFIGCPTIGM